MSHYYEALGVSPQELKTLQEVFQIYAKKDCISLEQLQQILLDLGITVPIQTIADVLDLNQDKKIDFYEFMLAISYYIPPVYPSVTEKQERELLTCFLYFDKNHDGRISQLELEQAMKKLNAQLSTQEIKEMMKMADMNQDGFVDFDEFKQLLASH
ncbi:hypothetical protein CU098_008091 [Rhizopus stolonifer]|uniref:EF-hand domain-containing protein n=1 Tax=Rhizopus stolonifer TaxID=4846 RepID=A0A367KKT5_RHIST|nr:hypothetical protein CU098_008091 [Rhizopus stolonifer]